MTDCLTCGASPDDGGSRDCPACGPQRLRAQGGGMTDTVRNIMVEVELGDVIDAALSGGKEG